MEKAILFAALMLAGLSTNAQTTIKAQSLYDVNQDDLVNIADVSTLVKTVAENLTTEKTVVDTENLTELLNSLSYRLSYIEKKLDIQYGTDGKMHDEYVDLGLPSGTMWATCNVGADSPEDYGDYFGWGETAVQSSTTYSWGTYKWMASGHNDWRFVTKYTYQDGQTSGSWYNDNDEYIGTTVDGVTYKNLKTLEAADDAATVCWGSKWCMPTQAQFAELISTDNTTTTWTTENGVNGLRVTSKSNSNSIFLPAGGSLEDGEYYRRDVYGYYWANEFGTDGSSDYSCRLRFNSSESSAESYYNRYSGHTIRPVRATTSN